MRFHVPLETLDCSALQVVGLAFKFGLASAFNGHLRVCGLCRWRRLAEQHTLANIEVGPCCRVLEPLRPPRALSSTFAPPFAALGTDHAL